MIDFIATDVVRDFILQRNLPSIPFWPAGGLNNFRNMYDCSTLKPTWPFFFLLILMRIFQGCKPKPKLYPQLKQMIVSTNLYWEPDVGELHRGIHIWTAPLASEIPPAFSWLETWLSGNERVLFVSLGSWQSTYRLSPILFVSDLLLSLRNCLKLKILWVTNSERKDQFSPDFLTSCGDGEDLTKEIILIKWVPQSAVIAHPSVYAVVSHCGWGGTQECLTFGKPVLMFPMQADQPLNADLLLRTGLGFPLKAKVMKLLKSNKSDVFSARAEQASGIHDLIEEICTFLSNATSLGVSVKKQVSEAAASSNDRLLEGIQMLYGHRYERF